MSSETPNKSFSPYISQIVSILRQLRPYIDHSLPYVKRAYALLVKLHAEYWQDGYGELLYCVLMIFFGGQFALTILSVQAFNQAGGNIIRQSIADLRTTFTDSLRKIQDEPEGKRLFDKDGDGTVTADEVFTTVYDAVTKDKDKDKNLQLTSVLLKCVDPNRLMEVLIGLWAGVVAVIATLKSDLAKAISNGARIGQHLLTYVRVYAEKPLYEKFPQHKNWVDVALQSICGVIGIIFSLLVVRVVSAFNSALNGAHRLVDIVLSYCKAKQFLQVDPKHESTLSQSLVVLLVFLGLNWQLSNGFAPPWYFRPLLLPLSIFESIITLVATY
jgi:hypothetical protein